MVDAAYRNALAKRNHAVELVNQLQQQLNGLIKEIHDIDEFLESWKKFANEDELHKAELQIAKLALPSIKPIKRVRNPKKEEVAEASVGIIKELNRPISRSELLRLLTQRGIIIQGDNPEMVLSTMLWRQKDKIVRLPKGGYWLPETPERIK